jgi:hypothetical protein
MSVWLLFDVFWRKKWPDAVLIRLISFDGDQPHVESSIPSNGSCGIATNSADMVLFFEKIDSTTLTTTSL